jgi:hypothetical protein
MRIRKAYPENPCTSVLGSVNKRPEAEIYCRGLRLITSNNGTNKGVDRHHCSIRKPDGYWEPLEQIEKELRQAKNDYKHLASGDLHSCIN